MTTTRPRNPFHYPGAGPRFEDAPKGVHDGIAGWCRQMLAAGAGHGVLCAVHDGGIRATWQVDGAQYAVTVTAEDVKFTRAVSGTETAFSCPTEFMNAATAAPVPA